MLVNWYDSSVGRRAWSFNAGWQGIGAGETLYLCLHSFTLKKM